MSSVTLHVVGCIVSYRLDLLVDDDRLSVPPEIMRGDGKSSFGASGNSIDFCASLSLLIITARLSRIAAFPDFSDHRQKFGIVSKQMPNRIKHDTSYSPQGPL